MTEVELKALEFIRDRIVDTQFSPVLREIAAHIGHSVGSTQRIVSRLVASGHLIRQRDVRAGLSLPDAPDLRGVSSSVLRAELARRGVTLEALSVTDRLAYGTKRSCAADSCFAEVRPGMLMCRRHWFALPDTLQSGIKRAFAARDVPTYQALVTRARDLADGYAQ